MDAEDEADIEAMHGRVDLRRAGTSVASEGQELKRTFAVLSGWLLRTRLLSDGRRQVLGTILPGDTINFVLHADPVSSTDIECLTDVTLADITPLRQHVASADEHDRVARAVRIGLAMDEALMLANVSRLARQSAYERLGLMFLDLKYRLSLVHLADQNSLPMPLTQQVLSDALGLSIVHVNRTLKQLRNDGLVEKAHKRIILPDPEALALAVDHAIPHFTGLRSVASRALSAQRATPGLAKL